MPARRSRPLGHSRAARTDHSSANPSAPRPLAAARPQWAPFGQRANRPIGVRALTIALAREARRELVCPYSARRECACSARRDAASLRASKAERAFGRPLSLGSGRDPDERCATLHLSRLEPFAPLDSDLELLRALRVFWLLRLLRLLRLL